MIEPKEMNLHSARGSLQIGSLHAEVIVHSVLVVKRGGQVHNGLKRPKHVVLRSGRGVLVLELKGAAQVLVVVELERRSTCDVAAQIAGALSQARVAQQQLANLSAELIAS